LRAITEAAASCERTTARVEIDAGRRWIERLQSCVLKWPRQAFAVSRANCSPFMRISVA
jgi:hypothetical protein